MGSGGKWREVEGEDVQVKGKVHGNELQMTMWEKAK